MAKLTTARRKRIPKSEFGLPSRVKGKGAKRTSAGAFPMDTKARTINAKSRAVQGQKDGTLSSANAARVIAKANRLLKTKFKVKTISGKSVKKINKKSKK